MGNSMIPFSNLEPKDTAVYKLITTKPGEATAEKWFLLRNGADHVEIVIYDSEQISFPDNESDWA